MTPTDSYGSKGNNALRWAGVGVIWGGAFVNLFDYDLAAIWIGMGLIILALAWPLIRWLIRWGWQS